MIPTLAELQEFTKLFNQEEAIYKVLVGDPLSSETVVPVGQYATHNDINSGAMANILEYERRLARFIVDMIRVDLAQGVYLDSILSKYFGVGRPLAYTDSAYYEYVKMRSISHKESATSIAEILQQFSSQPVLIYDAGSPYVSMFANASFANWHPYTHDNANNLAITPDYMGGDAEEGTLLFYFRVKLQPINATAEKLIVSVLKIAHVAGVRYDIEYYSPFP